MLLVEVNEKIARVVGGKNKLKGFYKNISEDDYTYKICLAGETKMRSLGTASYIDLLRIIESLDEQLAHY